MEALEADLQTVLIHLDGELTECAILVAQNTSEMLRTIVEIDLKKFSTELLADSRYILNIFNLFEFDILQITIFTLDAR